MTVLITGGTGKTGSALARLLHASNQPFIIATRSGIAPEPFKAVKFDWHDPKSFNSPFEADQPIDRVYLVFPPVLDPLSIVKPFVELAVTKGVKRFVVLSATVNVHGDVAAYFAASGLDYAILRPTWFMENFSINFYASIRQNNEVFSVAEDGRIPWISSEDVAKVAHDCLVAKESPNTDYYLLGPELYNYDEAAALLSEVLGRKLNHKRLSKEEHLAAYESFGLLKGFAALFYEVESGIAVGSEEALVADSKIITGKKKLRDYFEEHKETWLGDTVDKNVSIYKF